jgi:pSer/pThr/pTyr-binding forkhead associated (FHA) protein
LTLTRRRYTVGPVGGEGAMAEPSYFIDWFPNKPVELKTEKKYHVGRGAGNEFYLPDYHASRVHAEIAWNGEAYVVKDLGSSNGTFVNGEQITEKALVPGDEVQIGMHVLKLRAEEGDKVAEEFERQSKEVQEWQTVIGRPATEGGLSGTIQDVDLSQIVQVLEGGRKTGRLYITTVGASGSIYFANGRIIGADYTPEAAGTTSDDHEAVYTLLSIGEGVFEFLVEPVDFEPRITESTHALLMEALRRIDEKRNESPGSAPLDTVRF